MSGLSKNPLASLAALGLAGMAPSNTGGLNPTGKISIKKKNSNPKTNYLINKNKKKKIKSSN